MNLTPPCIADRRREGYSKTWYIFPRKGPWVGELPEENARALDPRVQLDLTDPRVGRVAKWGGEANYTAVVRAVVYVDGKPESLLLEDWTGYPWVRAGLDAELRPLPVAARPQQEGFVGETLSTLDGDSDVRS